MKRNRNEKGTYLVPQIEVIRPVVESALLGLSNQGAGGHNPGSVGGVISNAKGSVFEQDEDEDDELYND